MLTCLNSSETQMMKYTKIEQNGRKKVPDDKAIPWIAASKSSDQKFCGLLTISELYLPSTYALHICNELKYNNVDIFLSKLNINSKCWRDNSGS